MRTRFLLLCCVLLPLSKSYAQQAQQENGWGGIWQQRMTIGQVALDEAFKLAETGKVNQSLQLIDQIIASNPKNWRAYFLKSAVLTLGKRQNEALQQIDISINLARRSNVSPSLLATLYESKGRNCLDIGQTHEARKALEAAVHTQPSDPSTLNDLAWLLATSNDARVRDGRKAVSVATKACHLSHWGNAYSIDTLAAAYAESGRFDDAVRCEQLAIASLQPDQKYQLSGMEDRMRLFSSRQAFRL